MEEDWTMERMDSVAIVVDAPNAAIACFTALGMELTVVASHRGPGGLRREGNHH
jgi:hypothetical protein